MGLHQEYRGPRYSLPEGRALIICTIQDRLGEDGEPTGVWESELTAPYYEFRDGRMDVDVASIFTGQNQNAGAEVANKMMQAAGGTRR